MERFLAHDRYHAAAWAQIQTVRMRSVEAVGTCLVDVAELADLADVVERKRRRDAVTPLVAHGGLSRHKKARQSFDRRQRRGI